MPMVTSKDGTSIVYETRGEGPAVILVDGAMCSREMGPMSSIADALKGRFAVTIYDRRHRGGSGFTAPHTIEREIEDIVALADAVGPEVMIFGISSGALLAAKAAPHVPGLTKLALFEAPMIVDGTMAKLPADFRSRVEAALADGDRSAAVKLFMKRVGVPGFVVWVMSLLPMWKKVTVNAHTLPYDLKLVEVYQQQRPIDQTEWSAISVPVLVMDGGKSPEYMRNAQRAWAGAMNDAAYKTLPGQTHNVKTEAIAPELKAFFA